MIQKGRAGESLDTRLTLERGNAKMKMHHDKRQHCALCVTYLLCMQEECRDSVRAHKSSIDKRNDRRQGGSK